MTGDRKPGEQRGGTAPDAAELGAKGPWAETAEDGIVPDELRGSDAPAGRPAASEEPATEQGIDPAAGDRADATTDGGAQVPEGAEPDLKDVAAASREATKE